VWAAASAAVIFPEGTVRVVFKVGPGSIALRSPVVLVRQQLGRELISHTPLPFVE
jgi:hypothetical protein